MKKRYIIDSLNLLNDLPESKSILKIDGLERAIEWLMEWAAPLHDDLGAELHFVVDGRGSKIDQRFPRAKDLELSVIYAPSHLTADGVIEQWIVAMSDPEKVILVSNDRAIQHVALAKNADIMSPSAFAEFIDRLNQQRSRRLDLNRKDLDSKWGNSFDDLSL